MKYILVNTSPGGLQVALLSPNPTYNRKNLHRPGTILSVNIARGQVVDILGHFGGNVEAAHESVKFSPDILAYKRKNMLASYVCNDNGDKIDIDKLLGADPVVEIVESAPVKEETPVESDSEDFEEEYEDESEDSEEMEEEFEDEVEDPTDDLTEIKYVGATIAKKLEEAGLNTFEKVANADLDVLEQLVGPKAKDIKENAAKLLE